MDVEDITKERLWRQASLVIKIAKVHASRYNLYFRKIEGYIPSGLGTRQAIRQNVLVF